MTPGLSRSAWPAPRVIGLAAVGLILTSLCLYFPGLEIAYYYDDFSYVFGDPEDALLRCFWFPIDNRFYRPLQVGFLASVQMFFGLNTMPVHLGQIALHGLFAWLVLLVVIDVGFSRNQAGLAALFMLVSQGNVIAVLSNDTSSQMFSSFFGFLSVWTLHRHSRAAEREGRSGSTRISPTSLLCLGLALLGKETGVSLIVLIALLLLVHEPGRGWTVSRCSRLLARFLPYVVLAAVYATVHVTLEDKPISWNSLGSYSFHLGFNVAGNVAMLVLSTVSAISSVCVFEAVHAARLVMLTLLAVTSLTLLGLVCRGLWLSNQKPVIIFLCIGALVCCFPVALLPQVSELYGYGPMPYVSALIGIGLGKQIDGSSKGSAARLLLVGFIMVLLVAHVVAVRQKTAMMVRNGRVMEEVLEQVRSELAILPESGTLVLLQAPADRPYYSVFSIRGWELLRFAQESIKRVLGREDIWIQIVEHDQLKTLDTPSACLILTMDEETGQVSRYRGEICR